MATGSDFLILHYGASSMRIQEFDYSVDLLQSILWQYNESTNLLSLINQKQAWYTLNQSQFWQNWYTNVFNLQTANLFGVIVWSYILNVPLYVLNSPEPSDTPIWGFNQIVSWPTLLNTYLNFGNGNFSTKGQIINLTLEEQRFLLRLRYFQLTTRGDVTDINSFLNYLLTTSDIGYTGKLYVLDGLNMTITYVFTTDDFSPNLLDIIKQLDLFPRPAGVGIKYYINYEAQFGFNKIVGAWPTLENSNVNFGHGNFLPSIT